MAISMHSASVPIFVSMLKNMKTWLDKAEAHAKAKKFDPANFLGLRLTPDMLPFSAQIQIASDSTKNCLARLAGVEPPKWPDDEKTFDELRARIQKTIDYALSVPKASFEGSETREITIPMGGDRKVTLTGQALLAHFSLPNFFFHCTMTYALLRQGGVELGKMDYLELHRLTEEIPMAYGALVERTIPVSRAKVYSILVDEFGAIDKLMGDAVESVTLEGHGIGSIRHVRAKGMPGVLSERLDAALDGRLFSYSLVSESALPIAYYSAVVTLADAPNGGCAIAWGSNWVPKGAPVEEVRKMLTGLYDTIIDAIVRGAGK